AGSTMPCGGRGFGAYFGGLFLARPPSGPAVTRPCPKPCGSDRTPKAFSSLSGAPTSFMPPPTRFHVPRISGVPSANRLIGRCETFAALACGCAAPPPRRPWAMSGIVINPLTTAATTVRITTCLFTVSPLRESALLVVRGVFQRRRGEQIAAVGQPHLERVADRTAGARLETADRHRRTDLDV